MPDTFFDRAAGAALVSLFLAACQTLPETAPLPPSTALSDEAVRGISPAMAEAAERAKEPGLPPGDPYRIFKGTGVLVRGQPSGAAAVTPPRRAPAPAPGGPIVLNWEGADLREVIKTVLGDMLNESYVIDAAVGGQVTLRTSSGIPRDALYATLETLLRMNGATMVKEDGIYKIVPQAAAVRGNVTPQLGSSQRALPPGYSVQIVPLRYVGVRDMQRLIEPFARDAQALRFDEVRNLMILAGTERELRHLLDAIAMFDVDWLSGMSAGVFTLQNADVKSVMTEFEKLVGGAQQNPLAGILRVVPIERMNAILVISPQPKYLEEAKKWIERLDRGDAGDSPRLYVFALQNSRAEKVAPLLQQAFTGRVTQTTTTTQPTVTPGTPAGSIVSPPTFTRQGTTPTQQPPATPAGAPPGTPGGRAALPVDGGIVRNLQAVADKDNNTIIIVATPAEYTVIEQALRRLDLPARQVVIEMTIAEVVLTDRLEFGVEWLFRGGAPGGRGSGGQVTNPIAAPSTSGEGNGNGLVNALSGALSQGFTYLISNTSFPGGIQAAIRLLDTYGNTKVISNPHISALDNQTATIKVGNRIPINQQTLIPGSTTTSTVTTTSQYIDTGVLVQVTPHINAGGLVTIEIEAEVSQPGPPAIPGGAPPINTRSIQTFVAVPTGETMVMGGLILDSAQNNSAGLPIISRIPVFGGLFGDQTLNKDRTELVLFVTPRVVETAADSRAVMDELRRRMERLEDAYPPSALGVPQTPPSPSPFVAPR